MEPPLKPQPYVGGNPMAITLTFEPKDALELYKAYMPFVLGGAIFIKTTECAKLGERVTVTLKIPQEATPNTFEGSVVWITPKKTLTPNGPGLGIQFQGPQAEEIVRKIIQLIDDYLSSEQPTDTI